MTLTCVNSLTSPASLFWSDTWPQQNTSLSFYLRVFSLCSECNSVPVPDVYLLSTQLLETTSLRLYCKSSGECEFSREQDKCARGLQPEMPFTSRYSEPRSLLIPASVEPHDREACSNLSITLSKIDNCIIITFWIYGWYWTIWISTYQCWNNSHSPEVHRLEMSAADLVHNIFFRCFLRPRIACHL